MSFLAQAAATREQQADHAEKDLNDPVSARINRDAAAGYRALQTGVKAIPPIDCENLK